MDRSGCGTLALDVRTSNQSNRVRFRVHPALPRTFLSAALVSALGGAFASDDDALDGVEYFETHIRPILADNCAKCHGEKRQKADLRLDSPAAIRAGGERGALVVAGDPDASLLIRAVRYTDEDLQMPERGKLADEDIAKLERWVSMGAPMPASEASAVLPSSDFDLDERKQHWAFQPLASVPLPSVTRADWGLEPLDDFILARLEKEGLEPAPEAERRQWIRRVTYDLTGLPPTPEEVRAFEEDEAPDAYEKVVGRLLANPAYGERWARTWLDLMRYAETKGHEFDYSIPNAWQYRDYVTRAFNADVPFDQFTREHIAGDLLESPRLHPHAGFNESVLGTGFWFLGEEVHSPVDIRGDETDRVANKVDVFSKAFLGLTVACARCHDHKFDAISTKDYYALCGFAMSADQRQVRFDTIEHNGRIARELEELRAEHAPRIVQVVGERLLRDLEGMDEYLLGAKDLLDAARDELGAQALDADGPLPALPSWRMIEAEAAVRGLEVLVLEGWVHAARASFRDERHPLRAWHSDRIEQLPQVDDHVLVASYLNGEALIQDGYSFGPRARCLGEVVLGIHPGRPIERVFEAGAAWKDATWDGLRIAEVSERDSSVVDWVQPGRTLRTPSFTLQSGKLHYLVRGAGRVRAPIDTHRMLAGPLHIGTIKRWEATDGFAWIEHDLSDYIGHRVHVEFSPADYDPASGATSPEFAVAAVVDAADPRDPPDVWGAPNIRGDKSTGPRDLDEDTRRFTSSIRDTLGRLANGQVGSPWEAQFINWLLDHPELSPRKVTLTDPESLAYFDAEAKLRSEIREWSRTAPAMLEGSGVDEFVLIRGSHRSPGEVAVRSYLDAISGPEQAPIPSGSGRLVLAEQVTDPANPQLSRVIVNRLWYHVFGRGLVATVDNFGRLGEEPSHPELLDYLAARFMEDGWSQKRMLRALVLSRTYRMASRPASATAEHAQAVDPGNKLLHRASIRRLPAESIRDGILAVSGRLDMEMFGPPVPMHLSDFLQGRGRPSNGPIDGDGRRSLYIAVRRNFAMPFFRSFDFPTPATAVGRRSRSNVPAQALMLMNDEFVVREAVRLAELALETEGDPTEHIEDLYRRVFARGPHGDELAAALAFVTDQSALYGADTSDLRVWTDFCHVLFNVKEFVFLD